MRVEERPVQIALTPRTYQLYKEGVLRRAGRLGRRVVEGALELLRGLRPESVLDALLSWRGLKEAVRKDIDARISLAAARGLLKRRAELRRLLGDFLKVDNVLLVLQFENPEVYKVIEGSPRGRMWLEERCLKELKELLGL